MYVVTTVPISKRFVRRIPGANIFIELDIQNCYRPLSTPRKYLLNLDATIVREPLSV